MRISFVMLASFMVITPAAAQWQARVAYQQPWGERRPAVAVGVQYQLPLNAAWLVPFFAGEGTHTFGHDNGHKGLSYSLSATAYGYDVRMSAGLAARVPVVVPYGGLGAGYTWMRRVGTMCSWTCSPTGFRAQSKYLHAFAGLRVNVWPRLMPYLEVIRTEHLDTTVFDEQPMRLQIGLSARLR